MNTQALADELNSLLSTETRSLARHLDQAKPYLSPATYKAWREIQHFGHTSAEHAERLTALMERLELPYRPGAFDPKVANYHFMSLDALLPLLIEEEKRQVAAYRRAIDHAGDSAAAAELGALLAENEDQLHTFESLAAPAVH